MSSVVVNSASANNLYADLQSLLQQNATSGSATESGSTPEFLILAVMPPGSDSAAPSQGTSSSSSTSSSGTGQSTVGDSQGLSLTPMSPQMLETLLGLQADGSNAAPTSNVSADQANGLGNQPWWQQQAWNSGWQGNWNCGWQGNRDDAAANGGISTGGSVSSGASQNPLDPLSSVDSGATAQSTTNANGSTSTTITYADGSTVTLTTAPSSSTSNTSGNSESSSSTASTNSASTAGTNSSGAADSSGSSTSAAATTTAGATSNSSPSPNTLEGLIAAQANALSSQQLFAQLTGTGTSGDASASQQPSGFNNAGSSGAGGLGIGSIENLLSMLTAGDQGATSQVTSNPNGSTSTTITYADGSSIELTTAAPPTSSSSSTASGSSTDSSGSSTSSNGPNPANYNLIEQMIQLQAQLLNPTATTSVTA